MGRWGECAFGVILSSRMRSSRGPGSQGRFKRRVLSSRARFWSPFGRPQGAQCQFQKERTENVDFKIPSSTRGDGCMQKFPTLSQALSRGRRTSKHYPGVVYNKIGLAGLVLICVCMRVRMRLYVHVCVYSWSSACVHACIHLFVHGCTICKSACMTGRMYAFIHACMHVYMYASKHRCMYASAYGPGYVCMQE